MSIAPMGLLPIYRKETLNGYYEDLSSIQILNLWASLAQKEEYVDPSAIYLWSWSINMTLTALFLMDHYS